MACTCTEDKFLVTPNGEIPWDGVSTGVIIGKNRVTCQECLDNTQIQLKQEKRQQIIAQLKTLEEGIRYSELTGDMYNETMSWAEKKTKDWNTLRQELSGI